MGLNRVLLSIIFPNGATAEYGSPRARSPYRQTPLAATVEKRTGYDWTVRYETDEGVFAIGVFGAMRLDQAVDDADVPTDATILSVMRGLPW